MKKLLINELCVLLVVCVFSISVSGCGKKSGSIRQEKETTVETSKSGKEAEETTMKTAVKNETTGNDKEKESETESDKDLEESQNQDSEAQRNSTDEMQSGQQPQTEGGQQEMNPQDVAQESDMQADAYPQTETTVHNEAVTQQAAEQTPQMSGQQFQPPEQQSQSQQPQSQQPQSQQPTATAFKAYDPNEVCRLATEKCKASGMRCTVDYLSEKLKNGQITRQEYDMYYPYDGMGYLSVFVETDLNRAREKLKSISQTVETIGKRNGCKIEVHNLKQREALNTALPIGVRQVETMRTMLTQSLAVLMPFNVQELNDAGGNYYGINQVSKNINIGNRKKLINGNGFVFGVPGSGKSFFCKMEMGNVFLSGNDEIIVIDPMNEYFDIAKKYGGTVINMSAYTDNYVNPLDINVEKLDLQDSMGWISEKSEFMLGLCEQCMGTSINAYQRSIIDRCVRNLYRKIAKKKPNKFGWEKHVPVMTDFYELLKEQEEKEAKEIALSLELFVNGSLNIFNHQTNVDVDNRFIVYGIRDLGTELSPIAMLVMMESIQQRIVENGRRGKATWLYIDEIHVLLNSQYSAGYLQQLWKKVRKQGGLCTGITQNIIDLLQNYTATTMLANSEFVALLKQANTDSAKMAEVIGVSDAQLRFVTNTQSGMGLLKCGSVIVPFDNQIGKDTGLYKLYNTNLHEIIQKKETVV